ncbi:uncharacterized protein BHQ10_010172 [Talaromyces amestolkiae]|uniref:Pectate lyase superfamily protein domain-containing protein n=1 Tax=Talaromyces amestolkiae TaxID=1196081 RepID=A0A364LEB3_TALAM|nr:uncharacterized protein BHQ10_010172 [Talaromyces amestolkiae]RAO74160.1 hypothetical protein BHQ10_010172 [Talaromyces amestolkiae]
MLWTRGASLLLASAIFQISSANFWVSPSGNDYADGQSASTPLQTLTEAQKRVRGVNLNMSGDLHVYLEPGTYHLTNPLVFTSEDSGSNGHQIVWQATDIPAGVNISGGVPITGWSYYDQGANIWQAPIPKGAKSRHFYVNQQHAVRSSYNLSRSSLSLMEEGFNITDPSVQFLARAPGIEKAELRSRGSWTDRYIPIQSVVGTYLKMHNPAFNNNIIGYDTFISPSGTYGALWIQNLLSILNEVNEYYMDEDKSIIYYKPADGVDMNKQYCILPSLEVLLIVAGRSYENPVHDLTFQGLNYMHTTWNQPSTNLGFVDQQTGGYLGEDSVYQEWIGGFPYWHQVPASVQASAVTNVNFLNGSMVAIANGLGVGNDPSGCAFPGIGLGASNVTIAGMLFTQVGNQPVTVGGVQANAHHPVNPLMTNQRLTITENIIFDIGQTHSGAAAIVSTYVTGAVITHNDIRDVPYIGISYGWGWGSNDAGGNPEYTERGLYNYQPIYKTPTTLKDGLVAKNLISDFGTLHTDLAAIYTLSKSPSTYTTQNCVGYGNGFPGLYHDEGSRNYVDFNQTLVTGNRWLFRNEYVPMTTGNLTIHDLYVQGNPELGTNSYGDNIYNVTQFSNVADLPQQFKDICANAGIPPGQRAGRPVQQPPIS